MNQIFEQVFTLKQKKINCDAFYQTGWPNSPVNNVVQLVPKFAWSQMTTFL